MVKYIKEIDEKLYGELIKLLGDDICYMSVDSASGITFRMVGNLENYFILVPKPENEKGNL